MARRPPPKGQVMEPHCPCCGAPVSDALALDNVAWFVGPTMAAIVHCLRRFAGGPLQIEALAGAVYRSDHGGPADGAGAARQAIRRGGPKLRRVGWEVVNLKHARGFVLRKVEREKPPESPPSPGG